MIYAYVRVGGDGCNCVHVIAAVTFSPSVSVLGVAALSVCECTTYSLSFSACFAALCRANRLRTAQEDEALRLLSSFFLLGISAASVMRERPIRPGLIRPDRVSSSCLYRRRII